MRYLFPRLVPWHNENEWEQVYGLLFSSNIHDQMEGVRMVYSMLPRKLGTLSSLTVAKQVKAWMSRGRVPHAIESTSNLLEALITETMNPMISEHELRMLYSMSFVRFVNRLIDPAQKGAYAMSMTGIAQSLGLPGWFVDLRHAATHDQLPILSLLRNGCKQVISMRSRPVRIFDR